MLDQQPIINEKIWIPTSYGFFHSKENIKFVKISNRDSLKDILVVFDLMSGRENFGVICSSLKESDLQLLRDKKISYCIPDQEIKIFLSRKSEISEPLFFSDEYLHKINPTLIVSPSGLEITDTILKLNEDEILLTPAQIARDYNLSRSKLSMIMTALEVKTLGQLREKVLEFPSSWWLKTFDNSITKRKMTPSKTFRTRRYVLKEACEISQFQEKIILLKEKGVEIEIGGLSYLKSLGALTISEYDALVRADQLIDAVDFLELRPAKKGEFENVVFLTPLIGELKSEKLEAKKSNWDIRYSQQNLDSGRKINVLRYLWGLNYDEERVKEVRRSLLEDYLNEIRKHHC